MKLKLRKPRKSERVYVSWEDIRKGIVGNTAKCPIAMALKRRFQGSVMAGLSSVWINENEYRLCQKGVKFIRSFDDRKSVQPFHLYIRRGL